MASLDTIGKIATSSLTATQVQLSVTSSNIANADTEGYTKKTASQSSAVTSGAGAGVEVTEITSKVSQLLITQLADATTEAAGAERTASYLDQLQTALGATSSSDDSGTSLANSFAELETALSDLANTPESATLAASVVSALESVTTQIQEISSDVQSLREQADEEIETSVENANQAIETIAELNDLILAAEARGDSTADLEDSRNSALVTLSESLGVTSFLSSDGTMKVYTSSGQVLVDNSAHTLSYSSASVVTADMSYDGTATGLSGVSVDGIEITDDLQSGTIASLLELRDETLPAVQSELDELASTMIESLNAIRPDLLSGTDATDIEVGDVLKEDPSELLDATGSVMALALVDALQSSDTVFDAAGDLGEQSGAFSDYATDILSQVVAAANRSETALENAETELSTVSDTISSLYGVNVDEETARLSELENLYAVSSQILSVIQDMFDDLMAAIQ